MRNVDPVFLSYEICRETRDRFNEGGGMAINVQQLDKALIRYSIYKE